MATGCVLDTILSDSKLTWATKGNRSPALESMNREGSLAIGLWLR